MTTAVKASLRFIGTCRRLRCTYIVHTLTRQVFLGCYNEVWFHRFPSPPFGSPFTLSPSHTSFPLSFHVFPCFMSFHLTPFVLLRVQRSGPWRVRAHLLPTQVSGRPGFDNEVSSVVPVHLVSLSSQPHTLLSRRLPSHVFILLSLLRAHLHIRPSLNFASRGVCVCVSLGITGILLDCSCF